MPSVSLVASLLATHHTSVGPIQQLSVRHRSVLSDVADPVTSQKLQVLSRPTHLLHRCVRRRWLHIDQNCHLHQPMMDLLVFSLRSERVQITFARQVKPFRALLWAPVFVAKNCLDASLGHSRNTQDWVCDACRPEVNHDFLTILSSQTHSFHVICHHLRSISCPQDNSTGRIGTPGKWCSLHTCSAAPLSIRTTHAGLDRRIAWRWS